MAQVRLQKILAQAGIASRRKCEQLILDGRVRVNGKVVTELGSRGDPQADSINVDGYGEISKEPLVYIALHKPEHVISTVSDPEKRRTVIDLLSDTRAVGPRQFEASMPRVYPVGRLDFDAEGIILLTNDGELANRLTHPRKHVPKIYLVKVKGRPGDDQIERLRRGVRLKNKDGSMGKRPTRPAEVRVHKQAQANTWLEMTLFEGRNHQVKRMCESIGHLVMRLVRVDFAGVEVEPLPAGAWRFLTPVELARLKAW